MIGQTISHYRIIEKLGLGGMGEVYLAEDTRLGRRVALKFLAPELARDHESLVRFRNEAKAAAELSHPNIATIHDIGEADGKPFLVLEYLQGQTLKEHIAQGPLPIDDVLRIGKALAAGLAEAHSHGIVHRDMKCANVMLTDKGQVKTLDFGLAHRGDATQLTRPGTTLGTIGYMSPEQAHGKAADERSDLWSLGVVLYECLTGRLPFTGETAAVIEQIKTADAVPPTALRTGIPLELEQAVLRCLEKDARLRYQHADDFAAKLTAITTHLASGSESTTAIIDRTSDGRRRSRAWIAAAAVLVAVAVGIVWWRSRPETVEDASSPGDQSVAVVDFRNLLAPDDYRPSEVITSLVNVGLIENSPCRVISTEYLHDLRRRLFGSERGAIQHEQALAVARAANASLLVVGEVAERAADTYVTWRLVDAASGQSLGAQRVQGGDAFSLADSALVGMMPLLASACGVEPPAVSRSVTEMTTSSVEAYGSFIEGLSAYDEFRSDDAARHFEQAVAADSTFALAYLGLAIARAWFDNSRAQEAFDKAWELRSRLGMKDRLRLEAYRALLRQDLGERTAIYEEMLSRWPDDRDVLTGAAGTKYWNGYVDEAWKLQKRAMDLYPDDRTNANQQVYTLLEMQRVDEALALAKELTQKFPENPNAWDTLGEAYIVAAEYDSAAAASRRAVAIHPTRGSAKIDLADCAHYQGDTQTAVRMVRQLLETAERSQGSFSIVSFCLQSLRQYHFDSGRYKDGYDRNAEWISQATDARSAFNAQIETADLIAYYSRDRFQEALAILDRAEASLDTLRGPGDWQRGGRLYQLYWYRGRILVDLGSLDAAKLLLKEIEGHVQSKGPYYGLWDAVFDLRGRIALAEGRPKDALEAAEAWMTITSYESAAFPAGGGPGGREGLYLCELLVATYRSLGRWDDAVTVLKNRLRHKGGWALGHYELGKIYEQMRRLDEAEAEYSRFLEMWSQADEGLPELEDGRQRLEELRSRS